MTYLIIHSSKLLLSAYYSPSTVLTSEGTAQKERKKNWLEDFPGGPVVRNPPSNSGDVGLIPSWGTKIPHTSRQLSPCATTKEVHALQGRSSAANIKTNKPQTASNLSLLGPYISMGASIPMGERRTLDIILSQ